MQQFGWLDQRQFLIAVAIGMISPGPVVITATFVGYLVAGFWGSLVSTIGIFLPSFLLVLIAAPLLARHRGNPNVQGFVKGAYAAAIGTILGACILLGRIAIGDWLTALIGIVSLAVLFRWKVSNPLLDRGDRRHRPDRLSNPATGLGDGALAAAQPCHSKFQDLGDLQSPHQVDFHPGARRLVRGEPTMNGLVFTLFALAAFVGGFVSGFSGFAMGLVVSGVWLHIITPMQTATLIAGYGLLTQGYGIFKLRHTLDLQKAWPLALGTIIGIPIGVSTLAYLDPTYLRFGVGVLLVLYAIYGLTRPVFAPMKIGVGADIAIGVSNGFLGGLTGLGGVDLDNLVPMARLAKRRAARGVSAGAVCGVCGYLDISSRCWYYHRRNAGVVRMGGPIHVRRSLVRLQIFWKDRRRDIPKDRAGASAVRGPVTDHAVAGICLPFPGVCLCRNGSTDLE